MPRSESNGIKMTLCVQDPKHNESENGKPLKNIKSLKEERWDSAALGQRNGFYIQPSCPVSWRYIAVSSPPAAVKHTELFLTSPSSYLMSCISPLNPMNLYHNKSAFVVNSTQSNNSVTELANPLFMDFTFLTDADVWVK